MLLAPPHVSYIIGFCTMWRRPGHRKNLWQSFMVVARADLVAPPVCPLAPHQFVQKDFCQFSTWICDQESFRISLSWGKAGWASLSWERALSKAPLRLSIAEIQKIFPVFTFRPVILISRYINISQCFNLRAYVVSPGKDLQESSGGPLNMLHLLARMKTQVPYLVWFGVIDY